MSKLLRCLKLCLLSFNFIKKYHKWGKFVKVFKKLNQMKIKQRNFISLTTLRNNIQVVLVLNVIALMKWD